MLSVFCRLLLGGCVLALAACGAAVVEAPTPTPIPPPSVPAKPTYTVERGEVIRQLEFTGRIAPVVQASLHFQANGRVRTVYVERGAMVTTGQLLANLEVGELEQQLATAQLELATRQHRHEYALKRAEIGLALAQLDLDTARRANRPAGDLARLALEGELAQLAVDELNTTAELDLYAQRVAALEAALAQSRLIAPFDGQLLALSLQPGSTVEAYAPVAVLVDPGQLEISAELQGETLEALAEGMPASVALFSRPGETFAGVIRQLPYPHGSARPASGAAADTTRISLDPAVSDYTSGDLVRVTVVVEHKAGVLWLPPSAIRTFGGRTFVVVQQGAGERRIDVTLGLHGLDRVEIAAGLTEGQVVIGP